MKQSEKLFKSIQDNNDIDQPVKLQIIPIISYQLSKYENSGSDIT